MRDFIIITAQPDDRHFLWEVEVQINNLRKYNLADKLKVLVYWQSTEEKKTVNLEWLLLRRKYPEVEFFFYKSDESDLPQTILQNLYVSALRPFCLKKYWARHPETKDKTVLYMDSDVIFTKEPNLEELLSSNFCYVSNTKSYLGVEYMRSKAKEVGLPEDHFIDIAANIVQIDKQVILNNDENCGGAQYILKGITPDFWIKVQEDCLMIRRRFMIENLRHFQERGRERGITAEDAGIQSWCADMWAVLYNLYYYEKEVLAPKEFDFAWSTDHISRADDVFLLHNAGVAGGNNAFLFDKTKYRYGREYMDRWPWEEDLSYVNEDYCSILYVNEIKDTYKQQLNELQEEREQSVQDV